METLIPAYGARIDPIIEREFPPAEFPFLSEAARYQLESGGKRLRPALCLLACEGFGGDPDLALPFAAAAEVLHNLFLLHDDIEDGDRYRRDRETAWVRFGLANAINAGDFLASRAYRILARAPLPAPVRLRLIEVFTETYEKTVRGQALDINWRADPSFTVERYRELAELKTGFYLAFNLVGAAIVAGRGGPIEEDLWAFGRALGPAFQIQDDLIDLTAGKGRNGEIGCDVKEGKPGILFAWALGRISAEETRKLIEILSAPREETGDDAVRWVVDVYERTGAFTFAREEAQRLAREAVAILDRLPLSNREVFREICRFAVERRR
ncbi:MAG: polyprenyl synthetase family protein [Planctomycetes bacterium]|nr:polyprenyl synthetase family protein [Planctomycetota bacterium]